MILILKHLKFHLILYPKLILKPAFCDSIVAENEKKLRAVFKMVDKHSHGKVDKKEVLKSLSLNFSVMDILEGIEELKHLLDPHHYEESFHEMDVEHHGYVTEDEFAQFARNFAKMYSNQSLYTNSLSLT